MELYAVHMLPVWSKKERLKGHLSGLKAWGKKRAWRLVHNIGNLYAHIYIYTQICMNTKHMPAQPTGPNQTLKLNTKQT